MSQAVLATQQDDPGLIHVFLKQIQVENSIVGLVVHTEMLKRFQKD